MKPQKQINAREDYIDKKRDSLKDNVFGLERILLNNFIGKTLSEMEVDEGKIKNTRSNMVIASLFDKVYEVFNKTSHSKIVEVFKRNLLRIGVLNFNYFRSIDRAESVKVRDSVDAIIRRNLGLDIRNEIVKDGFLDRFANDQSIRNTIKNKTFQAVVSNQPFQAFKKSMGDLIVGTSEVQGAFQQHYRTFAYDTYSQIDRQNQISYATKLNMLAFIYGGDIVTDSRPFCKGGRDKTAGKTFKRKTGEIFTIEEARDWGNIRKFQGRNKSYNPLTDLGGHNCRHSINYIDNETALQLRDDLFIEKNELKSGKFRGRNY